MSRNKMILKPRFWVIATIVILVFSFFLCGSLTRYIRGQNDTIAQLNRQLEEVTLSNDEKEARKEYMGTQEYIIRAARQRLKLLQEGEILFTNTR